MELRGCWMVMVVVSWAAWPTTALAQQDVSMRMKAWAMALGVTCTHCHVADAWTERSKTPYEFAHRMYRMVALNGSPLRKAAVSGVLR